MDWLTDAEWEEEVRCAALGLEGPNHKLYQAALAEYDYKAERERKLWAAVGWEELERKELNWVRARLGG